MSCCNRMNIAGENNGVKIVDGKEYEVIEVFGGTTIDDAVQTLNEYRSTGKLACIEFNEAVLYSDTVTLDGAYKEITGKTKAEFEKEQRARREEWEREEEEHKRRIPELTKEWIEKGHAVLDEKYWEQWDKCVPIRLDDLYRGMELGCTLAIVEKLNAGCDISEAREIFSQQGHSGMSAHLMFSMLKSFCDRGDEFVEAVK